MKITWTRLTLFILGCFSISTVSVLAAGVDANTMAIDDMRISNVARTEEEIKDAMNRGLEGILAVRLFSGLPTTWGHIKSEL